VSNIERLEFRISTDATAAGSAVSVKPVEGMVLEWVCSGSTGTALFGPGGTATLTAIRRGDGATILAATAVAAPFRYTPRRLLVTEAGGTTVGVAGSAGLYDPSGLPSADYITATVTQGGMSTSGTVFMFYDRHTGRTF
jgi:hypothetical protein